MAEQLLTRAQVLARTGLSRTTQFRLERNGLFPRRRVVGPKLVLWLESEIDSWIEGLPFTDPLTRLPSKSTVDMP